MVTTKETTTMGNAVHNQEQQITYLKERLNMFLQVIDTMDPEEVELEDVDRLLSMLDELELKCTQFQHDDAK
jgi:hypothetical protein